MDQANPFESRMTYRLHRAEYLVLLAVAIALFVAHIHQVRWLPAVALFAYIDLIGYIPGAIAWQRSSTKRISKTYYVLYNIMHSLITQSVVIALWGLFVGWEWALLTIPIHLFGDRALFGNFLKPFNVCFEPKPHPAYLKLRAALESPSTAGSAGDMSEPSHSSPQAVIG
jgi:hypothetical protein